MVKKETDRRQKTEEKRKTLRRPVVYCQHLVLSPFFRYHETSFPAWDCIEY